MVHLGSDLQDSVPHSLWLSFSLASTSQDFVPPNAANSAADDGFQREEASLPELSKAACSTVCF